MLQPILIVATIAAIVLLIVMASFNGLAHLRQQVRAAWGEMDDQLKRRAALLPMLVSRIQASTAAATVPLGAVIMAKNQAAVAFSPGQLAAAERQLSAAIDQVFVVAANEPACNSDLGFAEIRRQLMLADARIKQTVWHYNDAVRAYNSAAQSFPNNFTAKVFGFEPQAMFDL